MTTPQKFESDFLPVLPLKELVVFPGAVTPLFVMRPMSLKASSAERTERPDIRTSSTRMTSAPSTPPGGSTVSRVRAEEDAAAVNLEARPAARRRYLWARIGTSLTVLGFLFHVAADITRGIAAGRVPWSNMYEFALTGTMLIVAVYLVVLLRYDLRFLGTFITGLVTVLLGATAIWFYTIVVPLSDPL